MQFQGVGLIALSLSLFGTLDEELNPTPWVNPETELAGPDEQKEKCSVKLDMGVAEQMVSGNSRSDYSHPWVRFGSWFYRKQKDFGQNRFLEKLALIRQK